MGVTGKIDVQPQSFLFTDTKFCLPVPLRISGTFSTAPNTFSITSLIVDPDNAYRVIATVAGGHNLVQNNEKIVTLVISGAAQAEYNGRVLVTVTGITTFTYAFAGTSTSPATGTIIADKGGCVATGVGTLATTEFHQWGGDRGIWIYVAVQDAIRQVNPKGIFSDTQWEFFDNFPSNVAAHTPVNLCASGQYESVSCANTGAATGVYLEKAFAYTDPYVLSGSEVAIAPVCGDATGTTFLVTVLKRIGQ